jgi:predicted nuclease of predicted toxin-antitoxin system
VRLLIDECLHTSLVEVAHAAGHAADHVNYLGLGGSKDWQLIATIRAKEYTFVTNNRSDFLALHGQEPLHGGVIIIVPSVTPARQRELFRVAWLGFTTTYKTAGTAKLRGSRTRHRILWVGLWVGKSPQTLYSPTFVRFPQPRLSGRRLCGMNRRSVRRATEPRTYASRTGCTLATYRHRRMAERSALKDSNTC